ncbi:hypothetical protein BCEP4_1950005 [Burkholderia cepacia]|nr:hypothetical protein BCEP4_1950005 [Burkholderia cepacia]
MVNDSSQIYSLPNNHHHAPQTRSQFQIAIQRIRLIRFSTKAFRRERNEPHQFNQFAMKLHCRDRQASELPDVNRRPYDNRNSELCCKPPDWRDSAPCHG